MKSAGSALLGARVAALRVAGERTPDELSVSIDNILNFRPYRLLRIFAREEVVGVKPCLNVSQSSLNCAAAVVGMLRQRGTTPVVCDTTDRYRNVKRNAVKRMEELAVPFMRSLMPIVILDGIKGDHEVFQRGVKGVPNVHLAGELSSLGGAVVVSCPTPDSLSGISGAVVNMGVGFSSKRGKIQHYAMKHPRVHRDKCYKCRRCQRACPVGAIFMGPSHVTIDSLRCINCGRCTEIAEFGGITYDWDATPDHFRSVVTAHASAAMRMLNRRVVCINVLTLPPTADGQPRMIFLFSRDPVAIDEAALHILIEQGILTKDQQRLAGQLLGLADDAGLGHRKHFVEDVAF